MQILLHGAWDMVHGAWCVVHFVLGFSQFEQTLKPPYILDQHDSLTQEGGRKAGRGGSSGTPKLTVDLYVKFKVADLKQKPTARLSTTKGGRENHGVSLRSSPGRAEETGTGKGKASPRPPS